MPKDRRRVVSDKQEKQTAKRFGATQHPGSGSGHRRMDMHTKTALIECKTVLEGNTQITLKDKTLKELAVLAALEDHQPVLHFRLGGKNYVVLTEDDYLEMVDEEL